MDNSLEIYGEKYLGRLNLKSVATSGHADEIHEVIYQATALSAA
jgi:hypothetical protein